MTLNLIQGVALFGASVAVIIGLVALVENAIRRDREGVSISLAAIILGGLGIAVALYAAAAS